MQLSFIFLIIYFLILILASFSSCLFLFKRWLASFSSALILLIYIYLEQRISSFNTIRGLTDYFYYHFDNIFNFFNVSGESKLLVCQGILLLINYLVLYFIFRFIYSFIHLKFTSKDNRVFSFKKFVNGIMFIIVIGFSWTYFLSSFAPLFNLENGFMDPIIKTLGFLIR